MNRFLLIWFALTLCCFSPQRDAKEVSMISLIVAPEKYENMKISVIGVAGISFEVSRLFLDEWSFTHGVNSNSICLSMDSKHKYERFDGRALMVSGTFLRNKYCSYALIIENITIRPPGITKQ